MISSRHLGLNISGSSLFGHTFVQVSYKRAVFLQACRQRKEFKEMSEAFIPLVVKISCAHLKSPFLATCVSLLKQR